MTLTLALHTSSLSLFLTIIYQRVSAGDLGLTEAHLASQDYSPAREGTTQHILSISTYPVSPHYQHILSILV